MSKPVTFDPRGARLLNGAVSQLDRLRGAPMPERFAVDGRSLAQLLAFGARYGELIQYYDLADRPLGDWSAFFASDPAVALAVKGALDLPEIEGRLRRALARARAAEDEAARQPHVRRVKRVIVTLFVLLDEDVPGGGEGEGEEAALDIRLTWLAERERRDTVGPPLRQWHHHHRQRPYDDRPDWAHRHLEALEDLAAALINRLEQARVAALAALGDALAAPGHPPQAALWNAFVQLYEDARREMNRFPQRLLDYYHRAVLRQDHVPARPDELFLAFTLAPGATGAAIPKGTLFAAGTDANGDPIAYAADASLEVEPVTVVAIGVHRVTYSPDGKVPTGVLSGTVLPATLGQADTPAFPLFGGARPGQFGALEMGPASLGFIVESLMLMMSGGDRSVTITLLPSPEAAHKLNLVPVMALNGMGEVTAQAGAAVLTAAATLAFRMVYSTAGGWMKVDDLSVVATPAVQGAQASIVFSFKLPADAPPLVPTSAKPAPGAPKPSLPASAYPELADRPTVVATLLHESETERALAGDTPIDSSTYSVLSSMVVSAIAVEVTVANFIPPILSGPNGPLDPKQNFAPFGLVPTQFAAFEFSAPELFVKRLSSLDVRFRWAGLPVTATGFAGYYQNYRVDADGVETDAPLFDNSVFKLSFALVSPGPWALDDSTELFMFQTAGSSTGAAGPPPAPAAPVSQLSLFAAPGIVDHKVPNYYNPAKAAVRLVLTAPNYAFGQILYAGNLMAASAAGAAALRLNASSGAGARAQTTIASSVNATAPSKTYHARAGAAVKQAVSALNGHAYATLKQGLAAHAAQAPDVVAPALEDLKGVIGGQDPQFWLWKWFKPLFGEVDESTITKALKDWMEAHEASLAHLADGAWSHAGEILSAAETLAGDWAGAAGKVVAVARPLLAEALEKVHAVTGKAGTQASPAAQSLLPNQPWLPTASAFAIGYTARGLVVFTPGAARVASSVPALLAGEVHDPTAPDLATAPEGARFLHLGPFGTVLPARAPDASGAAPFLSGAGIDSAVPDVSVVPDVNDAAAFYIELSQPVSRISLLFLLTAGPDGWSSDSSTLSWQKKVGDRWCDIMLVSDGTNGLRNSGVVTLQVARSQHGYDDPSQWLRAVLGAGEDNAAYVTDIIPNALVARWVGPGGAATLGQPLPAGTIKASETPIAGLGSIVQPMQSVGGAPPATGRAFALWMAERLRHKGFAIDAWDYARIVLDAIPALWQLAVVPATDVSGEQAGPGHVWLVAVAGPQAPNIADPTMPMVDPGILAEIGDLLAPLVSPFARITVTNPPYLRLTVSAILVFAEDDTPEYWIEQLQGDLVKWLSPWPDPALGPRPAQYYSRQAIAEFIRKRPYVSAVPRLHVHCEKDPAQGGWHYVTSALRHDLRAHTPFRGPARAVGVAAEDAA